MLNTTLADLKCPTGCDDLLTASSSAPEIVSGVIRCAGCDGEFPILNGVAVLVPDVEGYLLSHVKGISAHVADSEIPVKYRKAFIRAKKEIEIEHIEEDLESARVNALYFMNHYLKTSDLAFTADSPEIYDLIQKYWDSGPLSRIAEEIARLDPGESASLVELGCGVGGLFARIRKSVKRYLGVDSSFASIAMARKIVLDEGGTETYIPEDLLKGPLSRHAKVQPLGKFGGKADFIVGDAANPPLRAGRWKMTAALNMIDMLEDPKDLPRAQSKLLEKNGIAIQSCPYIWHPQIAENLRTELPGTIHDSAAAVEWLYKKAGFSIEKSVKHLPWLFFKHVRQIELYSVHLFLARRSKS